MLQKINELWFYDGHFNYDQRDFFIKLLTELKPKNVLEIGWASGRSCITILESCSPKKMISIDINLDYIRGAREHTEKFKIKYPNWLIKEGNSNEILNVQFFESEFPDGLDFIFVDGCHSYECAKKDCELSYKFLTKGGVMIVDDFQSGLPNGASLPDVDNAVKDFANDNNLQYETWNVSGKGFAIFKK